MTTTTTISASASFNRPAIFRRAWALRRSGIESFGSALRIAWAEAKGTPVERAAARELLNQWANLDDEGKYKILACNCHIAAREVIRYSTEDHYTQCAELPAFVLYGKTDIDELINETVVSLMPWVDEDRLTALNEKRAAKKGLEPITLSRLIVQCAKNAISRIANANRKHSVASVRETGEDGGSFLETYCADCAVDLAANTALRDVLERLYKSSDENDRAIIEGLSEGKSEREISEGLKISNVAVHKRIVKIRERLKAMLAA